MLSDRASAQEREFDSPIIPPGGVFAHTFAYAGSFPYHCVIHVVERGTVVVASGGPPSAAVSIVSLGLGAFSPSTVTIAPGGTVTWTNNHSASHTVTSEAPANSAPDCSAAAAVTPELWPPNRRLVPVIIAGVTDPDGDPVTIVVTGVTQDEPVGGGTCPDAMIEDGAVQVRVEFSGQGNGRVYTIHFTASDNRGGSCSGSVDVCVPHNPGQGCVKDVPAVNSLCCD